MFIKNTAQKFANMSVYHEVVIPYGWMPLVGKSKASASVETDPLTAARESVKKVNMNRAMKDDSNKDLLMMSLVQSLCLQGNCLRKVILLMINLLLVEELFFL
jgi:hypothetical protein